MNLVLILLLILLALELILRLYEHAKRAIPYDLKDYPYYRIFKKNSYGRHYYYANQAIGTEDTPMIKSYSEGIRGDIANEKRKIVLCLGCSFTEGGALKDSETYPGYLQNMLNSDEYGVINAGVMAYGIFQISHFLNQLIKYSPEIVIVQLLDFKRLPLDVKEIEKAKKYFPVQQKIKKISILLFYLLYIIKKPKIKNMYNPFFLHHRNYSDEKWWQLNQKYLNEIKDICRKNKIHLLIFHWWDYELVKEYCTKNNIYTCDVNNYAMYYNPKELDVHTRDNHPNALSNRLVAKTIYCCLKANHLID